MAETNYQQVRDQMFIWEERSEIQRDRWLNT